ncbi:MAG: proteasome activator [Acidimicrobiia bacterium]
MVDHSAPENGLDAVETPGHEEGSFASAPKLMRIASMTRAMLEEIRQAPLDDAGRRRMAEIHESTLEEMKDVLSSDLRSEMNELFTPLSGESVTEAELRVTQAQLVGWLEGLFAGIQATLWSQQAAAAAQLQEIRIRAIEAQRREPGEPTPPGQYL